MDSIVADFRSEAYDSALAKLIDIEKEKPYDPEILNLLGSVYMKKKDFVSATKYFDLSLNKKPGFFRQHSITASCFSFKKIHGSPPILSDAGGAGSQQ